MIDWTAPDFAEQMQAAIAARKAQLEAEQPLDFSDTETPLWVLRTMNPTLLAIDEDGEVLRIDALIAKREAENREIAGAVLLILAILLLGGLGVL